MLDGVTGASSSSDYEATEVRKLCAGGGTRSSPTEAELDHFVRCAESLSVAKVGAALLGVLAEGGGIDWRCQTKALAIMEALVKGR